MDIKNIPFKNKQELRKAVWDYKKIKGSERRRKLDKALKRKLEKLHKEGTALGKSGRYDEALKLLSAIFLKSFS